MLHNGIGYVFPAKNDVVMHNATQTGSWQSISSSTSPAPVSEKVFSLWVNHGVKPTAGSYEYLVMAGADPKKLAGFVAKNEVKILANTTDLQAVRNGGIAQLIFYSPGKIEVEPGLTLQVDQPCMVQVKSDKKGIKVALSSPMSGQTVNVTLNGKQIPFELPPGSLEGSTQVKDAGFPKL